MSDYTCQVNSHGQRQLELNINYPLSSDKEHKHYQLDFFVFNPFQFGITSENYGVPRFLQDMRLYTRYTIPLISLQKLIDHSCEFSPLKRISQALAATDPTHGLNENRILYELRVLTDIYRRQLTDTLVLLENVISKNGSASGILARLQTFLNDINRFLESFRALHPRFIAPDVSDVLRKSFCLADEAISLSTENTQYKLLDFVQLRHELATAAKFLEDRLASEQSYRIKAGYPTILDPDNPVQNELFIYREGVLKKWAEGCLYMSIEPARVGARIAQMLMSIAAGLAMAFAVIATFFTARWFSEYTIPWAILIVVAYIAKDRIKEILRNIFISHIPQLVADKVEDLRDPTSNNKVGSSRARVRFCHVRDLPDSVRRLRNIAGEPFRNIISPEDVIHLHKDIWINSTRIMQLHKRQDSITEIIRIKLDSWLANMDDPVNEASCVINGNRRKFLINRVYHINLILCLSDKKMPIEGAALFRYRVVLTRNGIMRIEHVESFSA